MHFMIHQPSSIFQRSVDSFIAGIIKHAPEITAITNQWVNSYKRLHGGGEASAFANWGQSDRGALVRSTDV